MNSLRELERPAKCGGTPLNSEHREESEKGSEFKEVKLCSETLSQNKNKNPPNQPNKNS